MIEKTSEPASFVCPFLCPIVNAKVLTKVVVLPSTKENNVIRQVVIDCNHSACSTVICPPEDFEHCVFQKLNKPI